MLGGTFKCFRSLQPESLLAQGELLAEGMGGDERFVNLDVNNPIEFRAAIDENDALCAIKYQYKTRQVATASSSQHLSVQVRDLILSTFR